MKKILKTGMPQSKQDAVKLIHLATHSTAVLLLGAYSASLISSLSLKPSKAPFDSLDGLVEDRTYKFGVSEKTAEYYLMQVSQRHDCIVLFSWKKCIPSYL